MNFFTRYTIRSIKKKLKALKHDRLLNPTSDEAIAKEISLYINLAKIHQSIKNRKKFPFAELMVNECFRAAASLDSVEAQYTLGSKLLEEGKFREQLEQEELFANPSNKRQQQQLYEEAHAYLLAADNLGHIEAKRLRGLCYINGWGVDSDKRKGFDLIVDSIDKENSWDKVPQIFAAIGLNKPEFFSALAKHRNKS
ncbi:hypothetical protein ACQUW5_01740 [Legionella sp. CNM-1927-20]|uniref:hypothetical protein n=1 Tax=Legionella sp. CNM-1927-20 TaxID=3422221 RepID=UPI00403B1DBD